ncbi:MAG: protein translocase subunit SecF [Clostridium sp.]|nr:protein translocase subunit SecF [Clostridium sp.]
MLKVVERKKIWFSISLLVIIVGLGFMITQGLNIGIDFKGGSKIVLELGNDFDKQEVDEIVKKYASDAVTNTVDETQYEIKALNLDSANVSNIVNEVKEKYQLGDDVLVSQDEIGASIGQDLTEKSSIALLIAFASMLVYIAIRFEFTFGIASLVGLIHDILITLSIYAIFNITINTPFIAAILTIIGYSINATIVIFDRIRENSKKSRRASNIEIVDKSVNQTLRRCINTTLTTLFTIVCVYAFVPAVREFAFPIIVGILSGTYSSIFIAPSIWYVIKGRVHKKKTKVAVAK